MNPRRGITPALLGGLIAAASLGGFWMARAATGGPDRAEMQTVASSAVATVAAHLDADGRLLAAASEAVGGDPSRPDDQLSASLTRVAPSGQVIGIVRTSSTEAAEIVVAIPPQTAATVVGLDLAQQPEFRLLLDIARDAGGTEVAARTGPDGKVQILEARPLYGSSAVPIDVASRRGSLKGYVVTFAPESSPLGLAAPAADSDLVVRVVQGQTVLASAGRGANESPPASVVAIPVTTNGVSWTVQVWSDPSGSTLPWVVLAVGLLFALVVFVLAARREQSIERAVSEAESRAHELALIARIGPLLQQSLTLSDLLPAFVVEISDDMDLDSVSISLVSDSGRLVRVFSLGVDASPFDADPAEIVTQRERVEPNGVITVPLLRAGRVVGALRARTARGLSASQIDALVAVCNLVAAALGNARLYQDEQEMVSRLRDVDRMKTTFVSSVSHELRTTVTAIDGFAMLLDGDTSAPDDPRRADYVERIRRNTRSLVVLVEDLLDFARFERSGIAVELKPIDLSELVPQVVDQMSSLLGERAVSVIVEPGVTAMGDLSAVERILVNLLSNASKYTPAGSPVEVTLQRHEHHAVLTVADHGPGIPDDQRERVFELFYRVNDGAARATRGVGIGLALARQLVGQLDGTITVGETPGGGASFTVTIPLVDESQAVQQPSLTPGTGSK
ncbi:MAG: two-component system, OmpR family, phosphate regulon sensor histidine kinase PhoR [Acidimicrobiaceae bacterium]